MVVGLSWVGGTLPRGTARTVTSLPFNGPDYKYMNFFKNASGWISTNYAFPSILDDNDLPTSVPTVAMSKTLALPSNYTGHWVLKWTGKWRMHLGDGRACTVFSGSANVNNAALGNYVEVLDTNANPRVEFAFNNPTSSPTITVTTTAATVSGLSNVILCRLQDEAALDAAMAAGVLEDQFNPEYINVMRSGNFDTLRMMDVQNINNSIHSRHAYRTPVGAFTYNSNRWQSTCWAGGPGAAGTITNTTDAYTCAAATDTPGSLTDGEVIQGYVGAANTTTTPTLSVNSRTAKPIRNGRGEALTIGQITANTNSTFVYNALLDVWIYKASGITAYLPIEMQVALCNKLRLNIWTNIPFMYDTASAQSQIGYVRDHLANGMKCRVEYSNEVWNGQFDQFGTAYNIGSALGFSTSNNRNVFGWHGLRFRQLMVAITTTWTATRALSDLRRVMAFQAFGSSGTTGDVSKYLLQGQDLAPSGTHTGAGNSVYNTFTGSADYTQSPNRPIDFCDELAYAPYFKGAQTQDFDVNYTAAMTTDGPTVPGLNTGLLGAADDYASGNASQMANALLFMDWDMRQGTRGGVAGTLTLGAYNTTIYPNWETVAAQFDASRTAAGLTNLGVVWYEGGPSAIALSTSRCTALSISMAYGGAGGKIDNLLNAYKSSAAYKQLVKDQMTQFMVQTHSTVPGQFVVHGAANNAFSDFPGDLYSTPWQSWNAHVEYNT